MYPGRGVEKLMYRGLMGDLIRGPQFAQLRATQADLFVFFSYAIVFIISLILSLTTSSFVVSLILYALWTVLGFVFIALGTKLAHAFATWGIALVAAVVSLGGVWGSIVRLSTDDAINRLTGERIDNPGVLAVQLIIFTGLAAGFGYLTFTMARFIARMSGTFSPPAPIGAAAFPAPVPFPAPQPYRPVPPAGTPSDPPSQPQAVANFDAAPESPTAQAAPQHNSTPPSLIKRAPIPAATSTPPHQPSSAEVGGAHAATHTMRLPSRPVAPAEQPAFSPTPQSANPPTNPAPHPFAPLPQQPRHFGDQGPPMSGPPSAPYLWQPATPPPPTRRLHPVLAIIAGVLILVAVGAMVWLQDHLSYRFHLEDWLHVLLWTGPVAVVAIAVLVMARRGRRAGAFLVALITVLICAAMNFQWVDTGYENYALWVYSTVITQTVGATLAWGIARRDGLLWLVAVPVAGTLSALWVWTTSFYGPTSDWWWDHAGNWFGYFIFDAAPAMVGILLAWLLDVMTRRDPRPSPTPFGSPPPPGYGYPNGYGQFRA